MSETMQPFEADVGRVLDLVINSLYKDREIFLRELISNASDACDKLRYESLSRPELLGTDPDLEITILADAKNGLLTIADNGIGMTREELAENLGTIARSGTARFAELLTGDARKDVDLIGRFGVGFYSVFMVADKAVVISRRAGESTAWSWASDGRSGFAIEELPTDSFKRGTAITLHLKDDAKEFLDEWTLRRIVRTHSDHIALPIRLRLIKADQEGDEPSAPEQINEGSALWTRPKSEITDEQYKEFYHHVAHAFDEPFARVHFNAEGLLEYTALLFVPTARPFDLYDPRRAHGVKLYVKRVFITSSLENLLPRYLRFVSGIIDSQDLPLNVSRETLQQGSVVPKMRKAIVKRILDELKNKAQAEEQEAKDKYLAFWTDFGPVLKEGLYEDSENRERIMELARFRSTHSADGWTSLADYVGRMKPGQEAIYVISGESHAALRNSPQLEEARAKGVEVLLLDDQVDPFWLEQVTEHAGKPIRSLAKGDVDLSAIEKDAAEAEKPEEPATEEGDLGRLIAKLKLALGDQVADVRESKRLRQSAVCLVAGDQAMDMRLERFLKSHNQLDVLAKRILEVNPRHDLVRRLATLAKDDTPDFGELAHLLLDQARIVEGEPLPDPAAFGRRMSTFVARGIGT
ncbi:MAG TPA: molecular chaperone HtpG [Geminicoccus sp.]|uniref:molecular chaperone HtpG n=1 Tax=Geminicoccus sp. TaxID=2024832 RepID=UPI002C58E2D4|nr:molecular chaperone HtpG [Geminicoccus sp.]HWL69762.1 molecular chaperone HtpG [Geminicoccus sp.]